jgi:hypothetical protein
VQVTGPWKLATGWWEPSQRVDRTCYRVETADHQVFEVYHDTVADVWILDVVQD